MSEFQRDFTKTTKVSVTVGGAAAQEFTLLHNFIDVTEMAAAFPCMGRR